ncbi:MAG TPA: alpha-glucan family phosphorylase [Abditibacteriaceae bacterium]|nr:alpha-glucan family phosphorylase [Abditibacteriaceae bacterium]
MRITTTREPRIAYFSMEIGLESNIPTYSGGLGVLAGDTLKSAADLGLPMVAVSLLYRKGYFRQEITADGQQREHPVEWNPVAHMKLLPDRVKVRLEGRDVFIQAWKYEIEGATDSTLPVYFLDTDLDVNHEWDRGITYHLYGGDEYYRFKQEAVLGIGGVRMLRELGLTVKKYHMNEGHAALLTLELLHHHKVDIENVWDDREIWNEEPVQDLCVFTTHTPVEAGHDKFSYDIVSRALGDYFPLDVLRELAGADMLNMTTLGLNLSEYHNGVAKKHGEVSQTMFPGYDIRSITNGVHTRTWTHPVFAKLYDEFIPNWSNEPELFVRVDNIPDERMWEAHMAAKRELLEEVRVRTGVEMDPEIFTIGFARRATPYKRADLLFHDAQRLAEIGGGKLQVIYAGKAHPRDGGGKDGIANIFKNARDLSGQVKVVYLQNYEMSLALKIVAGVDVWLNTPLRPREASGTSGMKATHNGVPNFSVLDGWWIEGWIEGVTGWSIGPAPVETTLAENNESADIEDLYDKLEHVLLPLYYGDTNHQGWIQVMKGAVGKNACYFNTHRMMRHYVTEAYIP